MGETAAVPVERARVSAAAGRWWQLTLGVVCMSMIANLQYGWPLFVHPIQEKYQWGLPAIQVAFTILRVGRHVDVASAIHWARMGVMGMRK